MGYPRKKPDAAATFIVDEHVKEQKCWDLESRFGAQCKITAWNSVVTHLHVTLLLLKITQSPNGFLLAPLEPAGTI